jgi:S-DNA-T family DNA segregation ATPase FtsK/SpoIIIE
MATAAARPRKRDLAPDWRDALRASVKRLALRTWGAMLVALSIGGAVALATHRSTDPSFTTAAAGPPANWMGSFGAYMSDALLLLFGIGSALLLPVVAVAGVRMMRLEPSGRIGRGLTIAALGALLAGTALGLANASSVSGLPGGWGGAFGLATATGIDSLIGLIKNPSIAGPVRLTVLALLAIGGLVLGYLALGLRPEEKAWAKGVVRRDGEDRVPAAPRSTELREERQAAAPPKSRPAVAVAEAPKPVLPA